MSGIKPFYEPLNAGLLQLKIYTKGRHSGAEEKGTQGAEFNFPEAVLLRMAYEPKLNVLNLCPA